MQTALIIVGVLIVACLLGSLLSYCYGIDASILRKLRTEAFGHCFNPSGNCDQLVGRSIMVEIQGDLWQGDATIVVRKIRDDCLIDFRPLRTYTFKKSWCVGWVWHAKAIREETKRRLLTARPSQPPV